VNCERTRLLLGPHLDRELDPVNDRELQEHLQDCPSCLRAAEQLQQLARLVRDAAPYHRAPAGLEARIRASLGGAPQGTRAFSREGAFSLRVGQWRWAAALATAAAVLLALWAGSVVTARRAAQDFLAEEIVSAHVRSLAGTHLTDVLSSDQHTVKPWFDGRVDFAPPVRDLSADGFPLLGGRAEYLAGHPAAALVFQRNKHFINVFVWPLASGPALPPDLRALRGYNFISWQQQDLTLCAISDLNRTELQLFVEDYKRQ